MKSIKSYILFVLAVVSAFLIGYYLSSKSPQASAESNQSSANEPLYWVAPMDPNYRRDKPGKSPMGMDLIPVYANDNSQNDSPGTITIAPNVVNSLGVRIDTATIQTISQKISTVGIIGFNENKRSHIHPRVSGWIEKLYFKAEGEVIKKGDAIYELYSPELVNAQNEFLLALDSGRESLIRAAKLKLKALHIHDKLVDELTKTRQLKNSVAFYSPQNGIIDKLNIREGFYVQPGSDLLSIGDLSSVWLEAEVFEKQSNQVAIGDIAQMTIESMPGKTWRGKVDYVYPIVGEKNRTLRVRIVFDNKDNQLKPNMYAQVDIFPKSESLALTIPKEALIRTGKSNRVVLQVDEGQFKSINVSIGRTNERFIEILEGVHEGDKVVVSAQFLLDSESSKTSDFRRMQSPNAASLTVWVGATIDSVNIADRTAAITHEAIDDWGWPAMTMDFNVAESVNIEKLTNGLYLHIQITRNENSYELSDIHIMEHSKSTDKPSASVKGVIKNINLNNRTMLIAREAIEKWNRPAAEVDFVIAPNIEIDSFSESQSVAFTFEVSDEFVITEMSAVKNNNADQPHNH